MDNVYVVDENGRLAQNTVVPSLDSCIETDASGKKCLRIASTNNGGTNDYNALVNKPAIDGVELTSETKLADLGIDNRTDTMLFDFGLDLDKTILSVTSTASQDSVANAIDAKMPADLHEDWKIAGLVKWELKDASGKRIEAMPTTVFTMDGQTTMRMWFRTPGSENKVVKRFSGAMLLTKR